MGPAGAFHVHDSEKGHIYPYAHYCTTFFMDCILQVNYRINHQIESNLHTALVSGCREAMRDANVMEDCLGQMKMEK